MNKRDAKKNLRREWTREEEILALDLYCQLPFSKTVKTNPKIIELANLIGRTASSVAMKLGNFGNFDENLKKNGIKGLANVSHLDNEIWNEFSKRWEELTYQSYLIRLKISGQKELLQKIEKEGKENLQIIRKRINQDFFRKAVLASYNEICCISGLNERSLLEAAHISQWSSDKDNRLNPSNGLCLNVFLHQAYDRNIFSISPDYQVIISPRYKANKNTAFYEYLLKYEDSKIILPSKFLPDRELLDLRHQNFLKTF